MKVFKVILIIASAVMAIGIMVCALSGVLGPSERYISSGGISRQADGDINEDVQDFSGSESLEIIFATPSEATGTYPEEKTTETASETQVKESAKQENKEKQEEETSHVHHWVKATKTVHHEAETEMEWVVDREAWDETVTEIKPLYNNGIAEGYVTITKTIHHKDEGHYDVTVIKEAWDETVSDGFKCSECGAVK